MRAILIWVDSFEKFYQLPLDVWNQFQDSNDYNKLLIIGYSEHTSGMKFLPTSTNQVNELIKDIKQ